VHAPDLSLPYLRQRLLLCHEQEYVDRFVSGGLTAKELRRIGFPWSEGLVWRTLSELSGTMLAAELALEHGIALSCAGGTHHAHRDFGSGFCIFNDLAVTAVGLLREGAARRILVVDADVHQGDGTAAILAGESGAFTLSIHCGDNFPARKQRSDLDVSLPRGTGDEEYLSALAESLSSTIGNFGPPDLVLYDAGVDVHEDDSLGHLCVTDEGIYRRDKLVIDTCLAWGVPLAGYVGGGYAEDLSDLVDRHLSLFLAANELWGEAARGAEGLRQQ